MGWFKEAFASLSCYAEGVCLAPQRSQLSPVLRNVVWASFAAANQSNDEAGAARPPASTPKE